MVASSSRQNTSAESKLFRVLEGKLKKLTTQTEDALKVIAKEDVTKGGSLPKILSAKGKLRSAQKHISVMLAQFQKLERKAAKPGAGLTSEELGRLKKIRADAPRHLKRAADAVASVEKLEQRIGDDRKQLNKLGDAIDRFKSVVDKESKTISQACKQIQVVLKKKSKDKKKQLDKLVATLGSSQKKISKAKADVQKATKFKLQGIKGEEKSITSAINQMIKAEQTWEKSAEILMETAKRHARGTQLIETVGVPNDMGKALVQNANDLKRLHILSGKAHVIAFGTIWIVRELCLLIQNCM